MSRSSGSYSPYIPHYPYRDYDSKIEWYPPPREDHVSNVQHSPMYYSPPSTPDSFYDRQPGKYNGWVTPNAEWIGDHFSKFSKNPEFENRASNFEYDRRIVPYSDRVVDRLGSTGGQLEPYNDQSGGQMEPYRGAQLERFSNAARSRMDMMRETFDTLRSKVTDFGDRFILKLDVGEFDAEDIEITTRGPEITIRGSHQDREEGRDQVVARRFVRQYVMPEPVWSQGVMSSVNRDGILTVDIPKRY